jgi:hypothetical protein
MIRFSDAVPRGIDLTDGQIKEYFPVWSGIGLAYTGTPATGFYVKLGNSVTVQIDVEFDNVSNFGTGQYHLTLPFNSMYHTDVYGGSIHQVVNQGIDHFSIKGHLTDGSNDISIWSINSASKDEPFDHNSPIGIDSSDKFHMLFTYICE